MGNHRIQKFDTSTNVLPQLLTKWGGSSAAGHASKCSGARGRTTALALGDHCRRSWTCLCDGYGGTIGLKSSTARAFHHPVGRVRKRRRAIQFFPTGSPSMRRGASLLLTAATHGCSSSCRRTRAANGCRARRRSWPRWRTCNERRTCRRGSDA